MWCQTFEEETEIKWSRKVLLKIEEWVKYNHKNRNVSSYNFYVDDDIYIMLI